MVNPFLKDFAVKNVGLDKYQPAMILSICSGIGECKHDWSGRNVHPWLHLDIFSRPLGGRLCSTKFIREKLGTFETFTISVIGLGLTSFFAPLYITNFATFAVYGVLFGLCFGLTIGVEWSNVAELVETDILSDAITFIQVWRFYNWARVSFDFDWIVGNVNWHTLCHVFWWLDQWHDWWLLVRFLHCRPFAPIRYYYYWPLPWHYVTTGAACAGIVSIRRRCSLGEITEDEPVQSTGPSLLVTAPTQVRSNVFSKPLLDLYSPSLGWLRSVQIANVEWPHGQPSRRITLNFGC